MSMYDGKFHYPWGSVEVSHAELAGRVCGGCGGRKSPFSGRCWKCSGRSPDPATRDAAAAIAIATRALNAIWRHYPSYADWLERPTDDDLIRFAATQTGMGAWRNIGKASLAWIAARVAELPGEASLTPSGRVHVTFLLTNGDSHDAQTFTMPVEDGTPVSFEAPMAGGWRLHATVSGEGLPTPPEPEHRHRHLVVKCKDCGEAVLGEEDE